MASYVLDVPEALLDACGQFATLEDWAGGDASAGLTHARVEDEITRRIREAARLVYQGHLDLRAEREPRLVEVADTEDVTRDRAERSRLRELVTVFGRVTVERIAYRRQGHPDLMPADAHLNLPVEHHSHGLRRLVAIDATRGSFQQATDAIFRTTGQRVGKRQVEAMTVAAAHDVEAFYASRRPEPAGPDMVLAMSADAKGIVMRPEGLRPATAKAAASQKLATRLTAGEKRNKKRMAEVVAVFDVAPAVRGVDDILPPAGHAPAAGPVTSGKWLAASVEHEAADMITTMVREAHRRDPAHERVWICLVDGNVHQIERVTAEAKRLNIKITIIVDFVHVAEYLWAAAWCLHPRADPAAELWVCRQARALLSGNLDEVLAELTSSAAGCEQTRRTGLDKAIGYLTRHRSRLDYSTALANGWPIATGIIEGACRHIVADRLDITGARWGLAGAEAVLRLRALISNGDFEAYWSWHLDQEHQRIHRSRYKNNTIPTA